MGIERHVTERFTRTGPDTIDYQITIEYAFDTDEPMLGRPPAGDVE